MKSKCTRITLVRHGETNNNRHGIFTGSLDVPITARGSRDAEKVCAELAEESWNAIYSTGMKRTDQTARHLSKHTRLKIQIEPRLREVFFGAWEGMKAKEVERDYPMEWKDWIRNSPRLRFPGGELFSDFKKRVIRGYTDILEKEAGKKVAIFCHGGPIRVIILRLLGGRMKNMSRLRQTNLARTEIHHTGDWVELVGIHNDF